jgi:ATP-dependent DNA helicase RecQ
LALTASATDLVANDIMNHLGFSSKNIIRSSFSRPNLSYSVRHTDDKNEQLLRVVRNVEGSGIVYLRTREGCEQLSALLQQEGISSSFYHAGLPHAERSLRQDEWTSGKVRIMVATNAFGMGIDKADVRFVVHFSMCDSLENYYQESGRAGRDGKRSYALLLVASDDEHKIVKRFDAEFPPLDDVKHIYEQICSYLQVAVGDGLYNSYVFNIHEFCSREKIYSGKVRAALKLLQQNGYMSLIEEMENPARVLFTITRDDLYKIRIDRQDLDHIIRTILRRYNGIFTEFKTIDENEIATLTGYKVEKVKELLKRMWQMRIIRYIPANSSPMIFFDEERLPTSDLYISPETYVHRKELMSERFNSMLEYSSNEFECRSVQIQRYFGDAEAKPCGICDICLAEKRRQKSLGSDNAANGESVNSKIAENILSLLKEQSLSAREIVRKMSSEPQLIVETIDNLTSEGKISRSDEGKLVINE